MPTIPDRHSITPLISFYCVDVHEEGWQVRYEADGIVFIDPSGVEYDTSPIELPLTGM